MKRPLVFALECVVAMAIAVAGAWLAAKVGKKINDKANADVRAGFADIEIANQLRRIADAQERMARR
ncbi:MAG: hypothetical protein KGL39_57920 [Patescibacteria group bacterium]|nr:hypothetical protein [Patescibacteria group bacterium]